MVFNNMQLMKTAGEENADFQDSGMNGRIKVVRMELKQGTFTEKHRHESECVVMVLEGALRFHLSTRVVTLTANEMLRFAPGDEHLSEALCDSVVLNISNVYKDRVACGPFLRYDPDQYLWGV